MTGITEMIDLSSTRAALFRLNDLLGEYVPESSQTETASQDVYDVLSSFDHMESASARNLELESLVASARGALCEAIDYLDDIADADMNQDGHIPNKEMSLMVSLTDSLRRIS